MNAIVIKQKEKDFFSITLHAMERRLEAEGLSIKEVSWLTDNYAEAITKIMLEEVERAQVLSLQSKMMFPHPNRGTDCGEYRLLGNFVCYVVAGRTVVTVINPENQQLQSIRDLGLDKVNDEFEPVSIAEFLAEIPPEAPVSGVRLKIDTDLEEAESIPFSVLPLPRWLNKSGATIVVIVPDDSGDRRKDAKRLKVWLQREVDYYPLSFLVERNRELMKLLSHFNVGRKKITYKIVDRAPKNDSWDDELSIQFVRWWKKNFATGSVPNGGKALLLGTPKMARNMLALASGGLAIDISQETMFRGQVLIFEKRDSRLVLTRRESL